MYRKPKEIYSINLDERYVVGYFNRTIKRSILYLSTIKGFVFHERNQRFRMLALENNKINITNRNKS